MLSWIYLSQVRIIKSQVTGMQFLRMTQIIQIYLKENLLTIWEMFSQLSQFGDSEISVMLQYPEVDITLGMIFRV